VDSPEARDERASDLTENVEVFHSDGTASEPTALVGIGASAGGLEALEAFFQRMPSDTGMAFIVVQHLSPDFKSLMSELLSRHTEMPIYRVRDGMRLEANSVYLIPPKKEMLVSNGVFLLTDKDPQQSLALPIDVFFRSLAQDAKERAVGIVMSGTGSDGSRGVRAIHEAGGLVLVQDERSAKFDGMPRSALATGVADLVLPPEAMPEALLKFVKSHTVTRTPAIRPLSVTSGDEVMDQLLALLMSSYGIDFSHYKNTTVIRRIERRLLLRQLDSLDIYLEELRSDPAELDALYRDLLIGVTRFFRDPEAFTLIEQKILPKLLTAESIEAGLRIWTAGCATGEEAYSLAILLNDRCAELRVPPNFKIFATDAHRESLEHASAGLYAEPAVSDVAPWRLEKYFTRQDGLYKIAPEVRRNVVFAPQNVLKDPPFTKIDLLTCRNLLIYFKPSAQRKVLSLFHFALNTGGVLMLGPSESVGELYDEFDVLDQHWKVFQKRRDVRFSPTLGIALPSQVARTRPAPSAPQRPALGAADLRLMRAYDALLERFVPPSVLTTELGEIVHTFGAAGQYLRTPQGRATLDVSQMVHEDLRIPLSAGMQRAIKERQPTSFSGIRVRGREGEELIKLTVEPLPERGSDGLFLFLTFEKMAEAGPPEAQARPYEPDQQVQARLRDLEQELQYTREHLSATIEELETSNEELQATNEEMVAANEELQSTNEELHSVNEELYTVNAEYQNKIDELTQLTNDMDNLLRSTDIGTVFLDTQLRIRKLTPAISRSFHLLPQDIGRPIEHISSNLEYPPLLEDLREVLEGGRTLEREVRNRQGAWLLMRILPYRTETGAVEGVVLTFTDVTAMRRAQQDLRQSEANFRQLADFVNAIFWLTSPDGSMIIYVSPAYERIWMRSLESLCEKPESWLQALHPEDRERLERSFATRNLEEEWEETYRIIQPGGQVRWIRDRRYPVRDARGQVIRLAGISVDITEMKNSQQMLELTQYVVDNAGAMIFWMRSDGRLIYANNAASQQLGYPPGELVSSYIAMLDANLQPEDLPTWIETLKREGSRIYESTLLARDGREIPVEINASCVRVEGELYLCAFARDISQRRQAEQERERNSAELQRANDNLRLRNRELDEFAHLASHDLKEPLRAIITFSELLTQDLGSDLPPDAVRDLEFITSASARMQRLINDLLALSRAGRAEMQPVKVSLRDAVSTALEALAMRIQETGAEIQIEELPEVTGDATMLAQLYQNLISNALKFSGERKPTITITAGRRNGRRVFGVRDNGMGIRPEYLEKVFQPFRRLHVHAAQEGTGIGLAICRKVVERHGGRIWVESKPGQGAHFLFTLGEEKAEMNA
jgi:two-component system CheB/CheR fusion protein